MRSVMNLKYLEEISNEILMPFFHRTLESLIINLIKTESGQPLLEKKVIEEFQRIISVKDKWESLKNLATLPLC